VPIILTSRAEPAESRVPSCTISSLHTTLEFGLKVEFQRQLNLTGRRGSIWPRYRLRR
jgi:hypothetical protein